MTINQIIKKALERIKNESKLLTPEAYGEAFCKEAKLAGMLIEECDQAQRYINTLNKEFQLDLKQYRIKTAQELIRYLISKLNRMNPTNCAQLLVENQLLTKKVLESFELFSNKEAAELAKKSIDLLSVANASKEQFTTYTQAWTNFISNYAIPLHENKPDGLIAGDFKSVIKEENLKQIASVIIASLVPSIASSIHERIAKISQSLRKNPEILTMDSIEKEIKTAIKLRIALDKNALKEMILSLDNVLDKLSVQLIDMIEKSDHSNIEIKDIKRDLENLNNQNNLDFKTAHNKLYNIATALEENTALLSKDLKAHDDEVKRLAKKIEMLEHELEDAKKSSNEDFLTKMFNRRALDEFLAIKESEFARFERNYSVVMFDIDFFKKVNDTFGHEAGDAVLSAFSAILKKECRTVDIIGRFGGEEFLAILSEADKEGAVIFAQKVREHVQEAKFMYQNQRIVVTVSSGVAVRNRFPSQKATLNSADEKLYLAKQNGRNRVES